MYWSTTDNIKHERCAPVEVRPPLSIAARADIQTNKSFCRKLEAVLGSFQVYIHVLQGCLQVLATQSHPEMIAGIFEQVPGDDHHTLPVEEGLAELLHGPAACPAGESHRASPRAEPGKLVFVFREEPTGDIQVRTEDVETALDDLGLVLQGDYTQNFAGVLLQMVV